MDDKLLADALNFLVAYVQVGTDGREWRKRLQSQLEPVAYPEEEITNGTKTTT